MEENRQRTCKEKEKGKRERQTWSGLKRFVVSHRVLFHDLLKALGQFFNSGGVS